VLYVARRPGVRARWLARLIVDAAPLLARGAPPLTCRLAAGVAWADDPGDGSSFGEHRCRLLAQAACETPASLSSASRWRSAAARAFQREGLDLERPHLHRPARRRRPHAH
jgi:hypothetical protein